MLNFLLAVHFLLTIAIIGLILLQKQDSDGALGSSGGGAATGLFSIRGQANILTRATSTLMAVFMLNCLIMAKMTKSKVETKSVIDRVAEDSQVYRQAPLSGDSESNDSAAKAAGKPDSQVSGGGAISPQTEKSKDVIQSGLNQSKEKTQVAKGQGKVTHDPVKSNANTKLPAKSGAPFAKKKFSK